MNLSRIQLFLLAAVLLLMIYWGKTPALLSAEMNADALIPAPVQKTAPPTPGKTEIAPIKSGDEIPGWIARWELAKVLGYMKRYDESLNEYQKLLKEKPELTEAKIEMARIFFWNKDLQTTLRILEQIPANELTEETTILMADLFAARKDYTKAEPLYKNHLSRHPGDQAVRLKLADMLSWQKKYGESLAEYGKILKARPDDIQVRRRYAFVLIWAGKHAEAAAELRKTLD